MLSEKLNSDYKQIKTFVNQQRRQLSIPQLLRYTLLLACIVILGELTGRLWYPHTPVIIDHLFVLTKPLNLTLQHSVPWANATLITLGLLTDLNTLTIIILFLLKPSIRLIIIIALFYILRGLMNYLCVLPVPLHQIYHYPGFPTVTTNYHVNNDLFYSGHAGFATLVLLEVFNRYRHWLVTTLYTVSLVILCFILIVTRVHYTMDIYSGIMTAIVLYFGVNKVITQSKWFNPG